MSCLYIRPYTISIAGSSITTPEYPLDLLAGKSALLEETHLPGAFLVVGWQLWPETFFTNLLYQLRPVEVGSVEAFGNEPVINSTLAQP